MDSRHGVSMDREQLEAYKLEISTFGNIPISSRNCGIGCIFCKVSTDPVLRRYPKIPDISLEDLYLGFTYVKPQVKYVRLGAGVLVAPHSDPYLHPLIYDFINCTSKYFPDKFVTTVTTGAYIDEQKLEYLSSLSNFAIDLSLVTMQQEREQIIPRSTRDRVGHLLRLAPLNKVTLMFTGSLSSLKSDLSLLQDIGVFDRSKEILVRRIEYTKFSQTNLNSVSLASIAGYKECVMYLKEEYPEVVFTVPYLTDDFRGGSNEYFIDANTRISNLKTRILSDRQDCFDLICSESSYSFFTKAFSDLDGVTTHLVRNNLYGGSTSVAGLLNLPDILSQVSPSDVRGVIVIPSEMVNCDGCDILGNPIHGLETSFNRKVWIA